jgi:hypothetical protein
MSSSHRFLMRVALAALGVGLACNARAEPTPVPAPQAIVPTDCNTLHHEVPDDPPARAPRTRPTTGLRAGRSTWTRGPYTSVQVNVNAFGENIPGDAANESSLAVDPGNPSRMVIGWRQFDTVTSNFRQAGWAYSHNGGHNWTFPGVIQPGVFRSDPVLAADSQGNFYYLSLTSSGDPAVFTCALFKSTNGGQSWGPGVYAYGGDKEWMTIDQTGGLGNGQIYTAWNRTYSCCGTTDFARVLGGGSTVQPPLTMPANLYWGTLAVGPNGELYVSGVSFLVARSSNAKDPNASVTFDQLTSVSLGGTARSGGGPNPGGLLGQAWVATDRSTGPTRGYVYLLCSVDPPDSDELDVMFARSTNGGASWSSPVRINTVRTGWQWFGTMSVAPNGRIDVVWNDTQNDPTGYLSELYYSYSTNAGQTWSTNTPVSPAFDPHVGWPSQDKIGDYYHMVSDNLGASLAYAATFNGEQDVYFLRIGADDCNGNHLDDAVDLAGGTSADCNSNGTPDECEPNADCNLNGVTDICDIAAGTSADCTSNSVPDECEPDCNSNGHADSCDIAAGTSHDCNRNHVPDDCELTGQDCNHNGFPDACDIAVMDCNANGTPDDCEAVNWDCNGNGTLDACDLAAGTAADCNHNGIPDSCDLAAGTSHDCTANGTPDECETDCNRNGIRDDCDIAAGTSYDCTANGTPDECEIDCNSNGIRDDCDIAAGTSPDCNSNGLPDACEVERCRPLWNGFQDPEYQTLMDGLDLDGDGRAWSNPAGTAKIWVFGCESGGDSDHLVQTTIFTTPFEGGYVVSEYFDSRQGVLRPNEQIYQLRFKPRLRGYLNAQADWQLFLYDAASGKTAVELDFTATGSLRVPAGQRGKLLVKNPSGSPGFVNTGVNLAVSTCYDFAVVLDRRTATVQVYVDGVARLSPPLTPLQAGAARLDYFRLQAVSNGAISEGPTLMNLDAFELCVTGGAAAAPAVFDCNGNGTLDSCDLAAGVSRDCNGNGIPEECERGDFDGDGDVDLTDYAVFSGCLTDPVAGLLVGPCLCADFDGDDDVDLADFTVFQDAFGG